MRSIEFFTSYALDMKIARTFTFGRYESSFTNSNFLDNCLPLSVYTRIDVEEEIRRTSKVYLRGNVIMLLTIFVDFYFFSRVF